jgi:hypothetical protein
LQCAWRRRTTEQARQWATEQARQYSLNRGEVQAGHNRAYRVTRHGGQGGKKHGEEGRDMTIYGKEGVCGGDGETDREEGE